MTATRPTAIPQAVSAAVSGAAGAPSAPSIEPPAAAVQSDCGCGGGMKATAAAPASMPAEIAVSSDAAPTLRPGTDADGVGVTATWHQNARITGLWSINQDRNCWAHVDKIGWRKLATNSVSGLMALNALTSHAYQASAIANCHEADNGTITQIYVW